MKKTMIALLCAALALGAAGCKKQTPTAEAPTPTASPSEESAYGPVPDGVLAQYNGQPVTPDEFRLLSILSQAESKDEALNYVLYACAVLQKADELGVTPDAKTSEAVSEDFKSIETLTAVQEGETEPAIPPFDIPEERLKRLLSAEGLAEQLYERLTGDIGVNDEEDYAAQYADFLERGERYYMDLTFQYVYTATEEEAQTAKAAIDGGMAFEDAVAAYSQDFNAESGVTELNIRDVDVGDELGARLLALQAGGIAEITPFANGFVLARVTKNERPSDEDIRAQFREGFIQNERFNAFGLLVDEWMNAADFQVNDEELAKL